MKVSFVIPYLEVDEHKKEILQRCIDSFSSQYDELIIEDSKTDSLAKKINDGLKKATGDFIVLSNDDVISREGTLKDLCHKGEVHVPVVHGGIDKLYHGHMACIPRGVYEKVGGYDESCPGNYWIDSEYWIRLITNKIPIVKNNGMHIDHPEPGRTLKHLENKTQDGMQWFIAKCGKESLGVIS